MTTNARVLKIRMRVVPIPMRRRKEAEWIVESSFQFRMMVAKGSLKAYTRQPAFSDSANTQAGTDSRGYNKNKLGAASWWTHHQDQYLDRDVSGFDATPRDTP